MRIFLLTVCMLMMVSGELAAQITSSPPITDVPSNGTPSPGRLAPWTLNGGMFLRQRRAGTAMFPSTRDCPTVVYPGAVVPSGANGVNGGWQPVVPSNNTSNPPTTAPSLPSSGVETSVYGGTTAQRVITQYAPQDIRSAPTLVPPGSRLLTPMPRRNRTWNRWFLPR